MNESAEGQTSSSEGILAPLRHVSLQRIWSAGVLANLGALIRGVGAAWSMTPTSLPWCRPL